MSNEPLYAFYTDKYVTEQNCLSFTFFGGWIMVDFQKSSFFTPV